ncbi:heme oxygenase (biliverdin-producing) [Flexivirga caeni]|uniref:Biliverdin-producing heme oxygenase n=1 Tax=Flexivirga caeni TaxID=2294115 RepID=A0A3M9M706_9MICO|nr:biliverdin-producing heme oxygenase [Flexivirga caeni]RNI20328.1 biliverdin-producing heme oxygenase [Flexivirga caeni]
MAAPSFSESLRARTWASHGDSEGAGFMRDLMTGEGTREDYVALAAQHYFVYDALEHDIDRVANDPIAREFLTDRLTRMPPLTADLEFLIGPDWRSQVRPLPATVRYTERIRELATGWPGGFVAHHYTRYLGDLSGGRAIHRRMRKLFGFDLDGVRFYVFDQIPDPAAFKAGYRERLDAAAWSEDERERVIDEVLSAYRFNIEVFEDLQAAKTPAAV